MYTIRYNNLDDCAADNCAMHCQSNIANNVKENAMLLFSLFCFSRGKTFAQPVVITTIHRNLSKLSLFREKEKSLSQFYACFS